MEKEGPEANRILEQHKLHQLILKTLGLDVSVVIESMSDRIQWTDCRGEHEEVIIKVDKNVLGSPKVKEKIAEGNNIKLGDDLHLKLVGEAYQFVHRTRHYD